MKKNNIKAFTLVEIMIWILVVSTVIIAWFQAYSSIAVWKINLVEKTDMQKDSFYFTEKLFQIIKKWWVLDYEEYFNRKVVWTNTSSGHYLAPTWFWNYWKDWDLINDYWEWFYYCSSDSTSNSVSGNGCFDNWLSYYSDGLDYLSSNWDYQRYWQYSLQFIDYNSNMNSDWWDENNDWSILWDDDDEILWDGPDVFLSWSDVKEIYLISGDWTKRTIIRWNIKQDNFAPPWSTCNASSITDFSNTNLEWCRWTIEFLKLEWYDYWLDHDISTIDSDWSQYDWVIDTWIYDSQFTWVTWWNINQLASDGWDYWKELFPDTVSVTDFKVYAYPNIDPEDSWKNDTPSSKISPYITINFKIKPSWEVRSRLKNDWKEINLTTTINLTDIYSK